MFVKIAKILLFLNDARSTLDIIECNLYCYRSGRHFGICGKLKITGRRPNQKANNAKLVIILFNLCRKLCNFCQINMRVGYQNQDDGNVSLTQKLLMVSKPSDQM